jgi:hypothetical protein
MSLKGVKALREGSQYMGVEKGWVKRGQLKMGFRVNIGEKKRLMDPTPSPIVNLRVLQFSPHNKSAIFFF